VLNRALVPVARLATRLLLNTDARRTLERRILPVLVADDRFQRILFVGCEWYTWRYTVLFAHREFWTIERRPIASRRYGGRRAVNDDVRHLDRHFEAASFDAVICNGVFGWGLDTATDAAAAVDQFRRVLKPDGLLVVGWTDADGRRPISFADPALVPGFEPLVFEPLGTSRHVTTNELRHVFSFFRRQASARTPPTFAPRA
jgi:SAM-dependent methyltransferase